MAQKIKLDFGNFILEGELFHSEICEKLRGILPLTVELTSWGREVYGPINVDLGQKNPVPEIPPGGIAYTNNGNYICVFFGQTPAWSVEYIGQIKDDQWKRLLEDRGYESVVISIVE